MDPSSTDLDAFSLQGKRSSDELRARMGTTRFERAFSGLEPDVVAVLHYIPMVSPPGFAPGLDGLQPTVLLLHYGELYEPRGIRTPGPLVKSQMLYDLRLQTELSVHFNILISSITKFLKKFKELMTLKQDLIMTIRCGCH